MDGRGCGREISELYNKMKKLFGSKKDKKKKDAPDTKEALQGINSQLSLIEEKQKSLMARISTSEKQAKELYRNKNQRAAVLEMKKSKMLQKELNKVEGMQILLMQQKMGLEGKFTLIHSRCHL